MNVTGEIAFWQIRNGVVVRSQRKKNLVVTLSRQILGNLARGAPLSSELNTIAIGTGSTAPATSDTSLETEVYRMALPSASSTATPLAGNTITTDPVQVTLRQTLTPFVASSGVPTTPLVGTQVIREFGLFADILTIANPATPTIASQDTTGTVPAETYNVKITWVNNNGETAASSAVNHVQSSVGSFTVSMGTAPAEAAKARIYIESVTEGSGDYYLFGTEVTDLTSDPVTFNVSTDPPITGTVAPSTNTSTVPGTLNSGSLFNRAIIGEPGGVSMSGTDQIMIESKLTFG